MTGDVMFTATLGLLVLAAHHVWLRPRLARRLHARLVAPFSRWVWDTRRTLAAACRAATFHLYRPRHLRRHP